jgi:eukaryotic-like serine/threonine-protein kinase
MNASQWLTVKELFPQVIELPRDERTVFLQSHIRDPQTLSEIKSLLREHEEEEFECFPNSERFSPRRRLGSGFFGTVFEAYDKEQQIVIALKVLHQEDPGALERFKREFWTLREISHPNLVKLYQLFNEDGSWFFTMQLIRGTNFVDFVRTADDSAPLPGCDLHRLRSTLVQLIAGVQALHAAGKLHRDLKPDNILVTRTGEVVIIDLGLTREFAEGLATQSVAILGTPQYFSPEQGSGGCLDEATDWYSVGVILFQCLTGRLPFEGDLQTLIKRKRQEPAPRPKLLVSAIPDDLSTLCGDLLNPDPALRPRGIDILKRLGYESPPVPAGSLSIRRPKFLAREDVLTTLLTLLSAVQVSGQPALISLRGRSGMGKTTILREIAARASAEPGHTIIISGRCHESSKVPFQALDTLIDKLIGYIRRLPSWEAKAILPRDVMCLARLFPTLKQIDSIARMRVLAGDALDPHDLRERAFEALIELLGRLGNEARVLVTLDDAQWSDQDSVAWLKRLLTHPSPPTVFFIVAYRSEDSSSNPLLRDYEAALNSSNPKFRLLRLELEELSAHDAERLAGHLLVDGIPNAESIRKSILEEAAGVPFLISELATYANKSFQEGGVPLCTVEEVIRRRIDALPTAGKRMLHVLAAASQPVLEVVATKAARLESDDFPGLQTLSAERMVRVRESALGRELEIYHDRYREVALLSMDPPFGSKLI